MDNIIAEANQSIMIGMIFARRSSKIAEDAFFERAARIKVIKVSPYNVRITSR